MATTTTTSLSFSSNPVWMGGFLDLVALQPRLISQFASEQIPPSGATDSGIIWNWSERQLTAISTTITDAIADPTTTTSIPVVDASIFAIHDVLDFKTATGGSVDERCLVTDINTSTNILTVTRNLESFASANATLAEGYVVQYTRASKETEKASELRDNTTKNTTRLYNYTQLMTASTEITRRAMKTTQWLTTPNGMQPMLQQDQRYQGLTQMMRDLNHVLIYGLRIAPTSANENRSMAGGLDYYLKDSTLNVNAGGSAISLDMVNEVFKEAAANGASDMVSLLACHPTQAMKISKFNTSRNNPLTNALSGQTFAGEWVNQLVGFTGQRGTVFLDDNLPEDKIYLLSPELIRVGYFDNMSVEDVSLPGDETKKLKYRVDASVKVINGKYCHGVIKNLAI